MHPLRTLLCGALCVGVVSAHALTLDIDATSSTPTKAHFDAGDYSATVISGTCSGYRSSPDAGVSEAVSLQPDHVPYVVTFDVCLPGATACTRYGTARTAS